MISIVMLLNRLKFDFMKTSGRPPFVLLPILFFLALIFPPLLLFILIIVFCSLGFSSEAVSPFFLPVASGFSFQPSPRSPPF